VGPKRGLIKTDTLILFFNLHHIVEAWLVRVLPFWLQDLSIAL
jgi:hypothetical protein